MKQLNTKWCSLYDTVRTRKLWWVVAKGEKGGEKRRVVTMRTYSPHRTSVDSHNKFNWSCWGLNVLRTSNQATQGKRRDSLSSSRFSVWVRYLHIDSYFYWYFISAFSYRCLWGKVALYFCTVYETSHVQPNNWNTPHSVKETSGVSNHHYST